MWLLLQRKQKQLALLQNQGKILKEMIQVGSCEMSRVQQKGKAVLAF